MAIRAVIFDIGGVLEHVGEDTVAPKWESRLGLKKGAFWEVLADSGLSFEATVGKLSEEEMYRQVSLLYGMDEEEVQELQNDLWSVYTLNTEMVPLLQSLRAHYKLATLSNAWPDARRKEQELFQFHEMVDLMVYSYEEHMGKHEPELYQLLCQRLEVLPEEALFLDDKMENVEVAQSMGMHAMQFQDAEQAREQLQEYLPAHA